ncbi:xanthan lyase [Sporothrix schenckii 1099-18]|uniref:Xanthan lyase n=1 Tax=Sporothrix schenckii 1099-18 TaxID=1397361 RepID=A0A0F2M3W5_SPOSC|nr:xanthan lyase [Sporothrix schenckii 1099-18]KJR83460.1 xanthan lyase [Sporothrix schenckii 1099-18]
MTTFDLVVYGSTSAAVAAAIQAARLGRSVVLVSPHAHIGGIQVEGLGGSDIDNQAEFQNSTTLGGLNLELHERISSVYGGERPDRLKRAVAEKLRDPDVWRFESHVAEAVIQAWLAEYPDHITIIHSALAEGAGSVQKSEAGVVESIRLVRGDSVRGRVFLEASYEGDLLAAAGISTTHGREAQTVYGESLAGVRGTTSYRQLDVRVDPYIEPGNPASGLLYGVSPEPFGTPGDGDDHLQSYSFRVPLTDDPANRVEALGGSAPPPGYVASRYELHRRFLRAGGSMYSPSLKVPRRKTDLIGSEAPLATDLLGLNDEWPVATYARRAEILEEATAFTQGLLWFFANDAAVPASHRTQWARFGYCRDEFPDHAHFPRQLYVRDARRMVSDYVITEATATEGSAAAAPDAFEPDVPDPVALAFWPTDTHSVRRIVRDGQPHNEGFVFKDGHHRWRPFGIAYRALVPRRAEARNVLSATCPSASHVGYGAVRLEHQFYALGQACANAADLALSRQLRVQDVPYPALRARLEAQGVKVDVTTVGKPTFPE